MPGSLLIAAKDLRQRIRDRSAIVLAVIAPFALAAVFALLLPSDSEFSATYGVVDNDGGDLATAFTGGVLPGMVEAGFAEIVEVAGDRDAAELVDSFDVDAAFIIPKGFSEAVSSGGSATIEIIGNTDAGLETQIAEAVARGFTEEVNAVALAVTATIETTGSVDPASIGAMAARAVETEAPILIDDVVADSKEMSEKTFYSAAMAVMFLFFTAQFGILGLLGERRAGTLPRLVAAPVGPWAIVLGKALAGFVLGLVSMLILIVASTFFLGASWGSPAGVALLALGAVVSATGITALVSTLARTEEQAGGWNGIVAMSLAILGGTFFTFDRAPDWVANLSLITPHAWFLRGLDELAAVSASLSDIVPALAVLFGIGVVTGAFGLLRAKKLVVGS